MACCLENSFTRSPFVEASLPQQRTVDGAPFPLVLLPASQRHREDLPHLLESVQASRDWLEQQLKRHGAILFRDFALKTGEDFDAFVEAFGWEEMEYVGFAPRTQVLNRVYTANEAPPEAYIFFHHEMCRHVSQFILKITSRKLRVRQQMGIFPSKVFFFCEIKPKEGGQTPIVLSHKVTERMQKEFPDFVKNVEESGLRYTQVLSSRTDHSSFRGNSWPGLFKTTDEGEAEKRAARMGARLEWLPDKSVKFIQGPYKSIRVLDDRGRKAWFNNMVGYHSPDSDAVTLGDGSPLPADAVAACARIQQEEAAAIPWEGGDVVLVDNLAAMHGRSPCKPPRRVLASLC